jgi:hypothetical protein
MGNTMSVQRSYSFSEGYGICVALKHGVIIVANNETKQLHMHSLADGSLLRSIGVRGRGKGQFDFWWNGLCVSPDGDSVLVAEKSNHRVQQVRIVDGAWVRFVGEGVLIRPGFVDCNADVIAVSEPSCHRISVLSWADGSVRAQFGSQGSGPGQLNLPCGIRLLADGSGLVVADMCNDRLCVFTLTSKQNKRLFTCCAWTRRPRDSDQARVTMVGSKEEGLCCPHNVLECASDGSFIVTNSGLRRELIKLTRDGPEVWAFGERRAGDNPYLPRHVALAALPGGAMLVRDCYDSRCLFIRDQRHRLEWIGVCVSAALL